MLADLLINLGSTGLVAFFLWLVLHNQIKDVGRRVDQIDDAVTKLTDEHHQLAREFSELRGEIRGRLGSPDPALSLVAGSPPRQKPSQ